MKFITLLLLFPVFSFAQTPDGLRVSGRVVFEDGSANYHLIKIYNQRAGTSIVPAANGMFELHGFRTDTFLMICQNYVPVTLCYKDSVRRWTYDVDVKLRHLEMEMNSVLITPDKTYEQIQKEIDNLGVKNTDTYKDVNAFQSPVTALWELFSSTEKQKREVAVLMNDDQRRNMMRELLHLCIKTNLIDLSFTDCDAFIDFCGFTDEYLQQCTFYDLLSNIKEHYKYFKQN